MLIDDKLLQRERFSLFFNKKLLIIAPQAIAPSSGASTAQCGQRVNECGQVGDNSRSRTSRLRRRISRELSPACPHARLRQSCFVHTESATTVLEQSGQRDRHSTAP